LKLYAFKCSDAHKSEPANNFYLNAGNYYAHKFFQDVSTASLVRKEVEKMIKVANSPKLIKLVNPARMHLHTEEDLMVVLQLQEPPSMDESIEEQKHEIQAEIVEKPTPAPSVSMPKKSAGKKAKKEKEPKLVA
jgi:hypothetical protein